MSSETDRALLTKLFRRSGAFHLRDEDLEDGFVQGRFDMAVADLGMDSLAAMEFCIAVETELGISMSPRQMMEAQTLERLADYIVLRGQ